VETPSQDDLIQALGLYFPSSAGELAPRVKLMLEGASRIFPLLSHFLLVTGGSRVAPMPVEELFRSAEAKASARALGRLFTQHGSDKAATHNYHHLYGGILEDPGKVSAVLEIGMGTNNPDVVSNMGVEGRPGASLRAFRDYLPRARIFGADVDRGILFQEERIETFHVDQTDLQSLEKLAQSVPDELDLVIDDGLHSPHANLAVLAFGLEKLRVGGWLVIEDIPERAIPFWEVVAALLPAHYQRHLLVALGGLLFAVQKTGEPG
jgi:hypothetical protein